jgi:membrane protease YdiL (CAAX protease family)
MDRTLFWKIVTTVELVLAVVVILLDWFIPTLVILVICAISLVARKQGLGSLGLKKMERPLKMASVIFLLVLAWTLVTMALTMPILNHLTGTTQDLSAFENLKGNLGSLFFLLLATWTLAAFGEEIVYRGFLQARVHDLVGKETVGIVLAVGISSVLFGVAHLEQGLIGVVITGLDAVFFSLVKLKYENLWGSILAHGLSNTVGLVAFFFVGPIYGLW